VGRYQGLPGLGQSPKSSSDATQLKSDAADARVEHAHERPFSPCFHEGRFEKAPGSCRGPSLRSDPLGRAVDAAVPVAPHEHGQAGQEREHRQAGEHGESG
jgi:hypothetical protein